MTGKQTPMVSWPPWLHGWEVVLLPIVMITALAMTGGRSLLKKTLPFGTAVSICLFLRALGQFMEPPWNRFQASTAIVTVVLLMEPGITLERLLLKFLQRLAGTFFGSILAVVMALTLEVVGKEPLQICCFCFTVFTMFGAFQVLRSSLSLMFSAMCISCAAVMFGFMISGWALIHSQVASVLLGEIISLLSSLFFELLLGDASSSFSMVHLVKSSKHILDCTRTAIDLVFTKHQAALLASPSSRAEQFRRAGRSRTLSGSLIDLLTRPVGQGSSDVVARLGALEDDEAVLAGRCRSCVTDITAISFFTNGMDVQVWFSKGSDRHMSYDLLPQQVHGLFLQACALAHVTPLKHEDWRGSVGASFQKVRRSLAVALECLKFILDCLNIFGSHFANRCGSLERLCDNLEDARSELQKAWKASKGQHGGNSLHSAAALCQGFDSLVVEMATFALFYLQWLKVEEKESELQDRLSELLNSSPLCVRADEDTQ